MGEVYVALLVENEGGTTALLGVTVLGCSLKRDVAVSKSLDYIRDNGGVEGWMDIHKKDDELPAEEVFTKRDFKADIWVLKCDLYE